MRWYLINNLLIFARTACVTPGTAGISYYRSKKATESWSSVSIVTRLGAGRPGNLYSNLKGARYFSFLQRPFWLWDPPSHLLKSLPRSLSPGREGDQSSPLGADVKKAWSRTYTSSYVFMAWCLIKHRNYIIVPFTEICCLILRRPLVLKPANAAICWLRLSVTSVRRSSVVGYYCCHPYSSVITGNNIIFNILPRDRVIIDGFWVGNRIYWTVIQLVTTLNKSVQHTDQCSHSCCLVTASNHAYSLASGLPNCPWLSTSNFSRQFSTGRYLPAVAHSVIADFGLCRLKSKSHYDRRPVGQCVLVSSPIWGSWPDINYCVTVTVLPTSGAPSDVRSGLSFDLVTWTASVQCSKFAAGPRHHSISPYL
jgi:hypothetical protein